MPGADASTRTADAGPAGTSDVAARRRDEWVALLTEARARRAARADDERERAAAADADYVRRSFRRARDRDVRHLRRVLPPAVGGRRWPDPAGLPERRRAAATVARQELVDAGLSSTLTDNVLREAWAS